MTHAWSSFILCIMNRLSTQLTLGFALVTLVTTLTVALLANARADATFRGYLVQSQVAESGVLERLAAHYAIEGTWAGAEALLVLPRGPGMGMGMGPGAMMRSSLALADADGRVVADPAGITSGLTLSADERAGALPILVQGRMVGYLFAHASGGAALPLAAQRFLATLNDTLWMTGALAGVVGLGLGLLIARGLAAPLARLAAGARQIAAGRLDERVPVAGPAEVQVVATAFNEMAVALERGEAQRRHMVADIAHELRTPLTVIQGNLRAMLDDVYPLSKEEVATIYETTLGLRRLVDDLLTLSRLDGPAQARGAALAICPLLGEIQRHLGRPRSVTLQLDTHPACRAGRRRPAAAGAADPARQRPALHAVRRQRTLSAERRGQR